MLSWLSANRPNEGAGLRLNRLFRPLPPGPLAIAALLVLIAGAAYCIGYQRLLSGDTHWGPSLIWSAYAVFPWLIVFEAIKRRLWSPFPLSRRTIAIAFAATAAASLSVEYAIDALSGHGFTPLALALLRRLPGIAACFLLVELSGQARALAERRGAGGERGIDSLRVHAPDIFWVRAAENYVELHGGGGIRTCRMTMREAAALFEPMDFVRIHRSFLVNRFYVADISQRGKRAFVRMRNGEMLPIGKAYGAAARWFVPSSHKD
jgi:hypothetical protein